jgi:hypothetical protein
VAHPDSRSVTVYLPARFDLFVVGFSPVEITCPFWVAYVRGLKRACYGFSKLSHAGVHTSVIIKPSH